MSERISIQEASDADLKPQKPNNIGNQLHLPAGF